MCLDPFCPFVSLIFLIRLFDKIHDQTEQWHGYKDCLREVAAFISDLDADRSRLSGKLITGGWEKIDHDIEKAKSMLERCKKLVDWTDKSSRKVGLITGRLEFAFRHKAAIAYKDLLSRYQRHELQEIRQKFNLMDRYLEIRETYLQETRERTFAALARQHVRHVILYTGAGVQTPQPHLFKPRPIEKGEKASTRTRLSPLPSLFATFMLILV